MLDQLRRMLEVGIHQYYGISSGQLNSSRECDLVTEIPRELGHSHLTVARGERDHDCQTGVPRPVVDQNQLNLDVGESIFDLDQPTDKLVEGLLLVMHRNDNRKPHATVPRGLE